MKKKKALSLSLLLSSSSAIWGLGFEFKGFLSEIERERGGFIEGIGFRRQNGFILVAGGPKRCRFGGVFFFLNQKSPKNDVISGVSNF